jgi:hypothetical protein
LRLNAQDPDVEERTPTDPKKVTAPTTQSAPSSWTPPISLLALVLACVPLLLGTWSVIGILAPESYTRLAAGQLWRGFVGVQAVLWLAVTLGCWRLMRPRSVRFWITATVVCLALVLVQLVDVLPNGGTLPKLRLLGKDLLCFVYGFVSMGMVVAALLSAAAVEASASIPSNPSLLDLRAALGALRQTALGLGWVLVAGVFSTSWLQRALEGLEKDAYPKEFVLSYGLFFSVIFVAVFGPCIAKYQTVATAVVDERYSLEDDEKVNKDLLEERTALAGELGLTGADGFQAVLAILSPLLGAITSIALGKD